MTSIQTLEEWERTERKRRRASTAGAEKRNLSGNCGDCGVAVEILRDGRCDICIEKAYLPLKEPKTRETNTRG